MDHRLRRLIGHLYSLVLMSCRVVHGRPKPGLQEVHDHGSVNHIAGSSSSIARALADTTTWPSHLVLAVMGGSDPKEERASDDEVQRFSSYLSRFMEGEPGREELSADDEDCRGCLEKACRNRRGFTAGRLFGLAPRATQPGGTVAILHGASVPFVLRGLGGEAFNAHLVGEAYVDGIMDGEWLRDHVDTSLYLLH